MIQILCLLPDNWASDDDYEEVTEYNYILCVQTCQLLKFIHNVLFSRIPGILRIFWFKRITSITKDDNIFIAYLILIFKSPNVCCS